MKQSDNQKGFGVVEVIIIAVVLALIGAGGWYVWQAQNRTSAPQSPDTSKSEPTQPAKTTTTFDNKLVPFTFEYPKDWTVKVDDHLKEGQARPDQYAIELRAPGTVLTEQPIGGSFVTKGARILIWDSKTQLASIQDRFTGIYADAKNRVNATVAGLPAVEYEFAYESDPGVYTELVKDGRRYSINFFAEGDEKSNASFGSYKSLVSSFKFK